MQEIDSNVRYLATGLLYKLSRMLEAPATIVTAPSGYGKTTAVRSYLRLHAPEYADICWFSAESGYPKVAVLRQLCKAVAGISVELMESMRNLICENGDAYEIARGLRQFRCENPVYLILDNFHLIHNLLPHAFLTAFMEHNFENLHVIMITQPVERITNGLDGRSSILLLWERDFRMNLADIEAYFAQAGLKLTGAQARCIYERTEGWPVAVSMHLRSLAETGTLANSDDARRLMRQAAWTSLTQDIQSVLLSVAPFRNFTTRQLCFMLEEEMLPPHARTALQECPFIHRNRDGERYEPHVILLDLLRYELSAAPPAVHLRVWIRAGEWWESAGETIEAFRCYWRVRAYERLMSLNLIGLGLCRIDGKPIGEVLQEVARQCPDVVMRRHPVALLQMAYALFGEGRWDVYATLLGEARKSIDEMVLPKQEKNNLRGDWVLVAALAEYPDIGRMGDAYSEAALLMTQPSRVISRHEPYMFGCLSPWMYFHREEGAADRTADELECAISMYAKLTDGNGSGVDALYRGELACMRGDYEKAEIEAYKASYIAHTNGQTAISYGAALLMGRVAVSRSNMSGLESTISFLDKLDASAVKGEQSVMYRRLSEIVRGMLLSMMEEPDRCAPWLREGRLREGALAPGLLMAGHVTVTELMSKKEYTKAIGIIKAYLTEDPRMCGLVAKHYMYIGLCICYLALGDEAKALENLDVALTMSAPDGIYGTFVRFFTPLSVLLKHPDFASYTKEITRIRRLSASFIAQGGALCDIPSMGELYPQNLTKREYEVARLAAQGLRNVDIAHKLYISDNTVKKHLKSIFEKFEIQRRSQIADRLM